MHRLENRTYLGQPNEMVTLGTQVSGSGTLDDTLDGEQLGNQSQFPLKPNPGDQSSLHIALFGAVGESCVVQIATVDGGSDPDLLLCQAHDPAPIHFYTFIVAQPATVDALAQIRAGRAPAAAKAGKAQAATPKPRARRKPR